MSESSVVSREDTSSVVIECLITLSVAYCGMFLTVIGRA